MYIFPTPHHGFLHILQDEGEVLFLNMNNNNQGAYAIIEGSSAYPEVRGRMLLRPSPKGVTVSVTVTGLPRKDAPCGSGFLGFHIHEGEACTPMGDDAFADAMGHYNKNGCPHPFHAGDMPPLLNADGYAAMSFVTDRFTIGEVIGKTVIIHSGPDDFTTQPAGNSGIRIACGVIRK